MSRHRIESLGALRTLIAEPPALMKKRLQPVIDPHCLTLIRNASVCAVGLAGADSDIAFLDLQSTPVILAEGKRIRLAWPAALPLKEYGASRACSLLFILPGIGFALRANGRGQPLREEAGTCLEFEADALFLHCSRAMVRADFWTAREDPGGWPAERGEGALSQAARAFLARSPYLLMLTRNAEGATELSPRGDPEGFIGLIDPQRLLIPERPGNKVAVSLSNILACDELKLAFLLPGSATVLGITGRAQVSADPQLLGPLSVNGKAPVLGTLVEVERFAFVEAPELVDAGLWRAETHLAPTAIPSFPKMLAEHMNGTGLLGKATTLVVDAVVRHDLKHLY